MSSLDPQRWPDVSPYLDEVLALPEAGRKPWLDSLRAKNPEMAELLHKLLEDHRILSNENFLEHLPNRPFASFAGQTVGSYRLLRNIGQGGMGDVWLAERSDGRFERQVAMKFLRFAVAFGAEGAGRFKREGRILAQLAHPNIAELIDAGITPDSQPYLVLEYVKGLPITQYCDEHKLAIVDRLRLFLNVLSAVALAHANLVVHRDIKPSNVFVSDTGQVKLLDFGIAKLLAEKADVPMSTQLTGEGAGALTLRFAAPEQVTGGAITTATDIYALGLLLFLLLTGQHPAGSNTQSTAELVEAIVETVPGRASDLVPFGDSAEIAAQRGTTAEKLRRHLRGDLDTILGKMLKKSPAERYPSATAAADDLQRFLSLRPISARPDTLGYRAARFVRRNRTAASLAALALAATTAGGISTLVQARKARTQRDFAFRELARADQVNSLNQFLLSDAAPSGKPMAVNELLQRAQHIVERENYANNAPNHVKILSSIGLEFFQRDENEKALPLLEEAYQLSSAMADRSARAQATCSLALAVDRAGQHARADALIQDALRLLPDTPQFALDRVFCLLRGSEVSTGGGAAQQAIVQAQAAERILQNSTLSSSNLRLNVSMDLASAFSMAGQYRQAIDEFARASALMTDLGYDDTRTAAAMFSDWGLTLSLAGRTHDSEQAYRRAIEIGRSAQGEDSSAPSLLNNYADLLMRLGRLPEASSYAEQAYQKAKASNDQFTVETSLMERSRIYRQAHDFAKSSAMLAEVEPLLRRDLPPGHYAFARLASDRAQLAQDKGDSAKALVLVNQAVAIDEKAVKSGNQGAHLLPLLLWQRSSLELAAHQNDKAEADAVRGLALAQASLPSGSYSQLVGSLALALGQALRSEGKTDEARKAFRLAAENYENLLGVDHPDARAARNLATN